jgi:hypothetical protein
MLEALRKENGILFLIITGNSSCPHILPSIIWVEADPS